MRVHAVLLLATAGTGALACASCQAPRESISSLSSMDPAPDVAGAEVAQRDELREEAPSSESGPAGPAFLQLEEPKAGASDPVVDEAGPVTGDAAALPATADGATATDTAPTATYGLSGSWGGVRDYLAEHGFTVDFSILLEANSVLSGGLHRETSTHALYDLNASFDLDRIAGWKDAHVSIEAYATSGVNPSENVGDIQSFSDFSTVEDVAQIAQVFYEQWFADHTCRLKLGKMDANSDFGAPARGTESIHSGMAYSPAFFTMVTYPNPATGVLAGWAPNEDWSVNVGWYDGASAKGVNTGSLGPASFFDSPADYLFVGELARRWKCGTHDLVGGATLGAWTHTGTFDNFGGGTTDGTSGFYGTIDQELSRAMEGESGGTKSAFVQVGLADKDVSDMDNHLGLGFHWTGCCDSRPDDALGLYFSRVHFSEGAGFTADAETACELTYRFQYCSGVALLPDLQYISNPGGDANVDDATVISLRCELSF
jgi:porin